MWFVLQPWEWSKMIEKRFQRIQMVCLWHIFKGIKSTKTISKDRPFMFWWIFILDSEPPMLEREQEDPPTKKLKSDNSNWFYMRTDSLWNIQFIVCIIVCCLHFRSRLGSERHFSHSYLHIKMVFIINCVKETLCSFLHKKYTPYS